MKQQFKIFLLLLICFTAITSNAASNERVPLWGSTYYGMTVDDVLTNLPGAKRVITPQLSPEEQAIKEVVKLDDVLILDEKFNVMLMFKDNMLKEVHLNWIPNTLKTNSDLPNLYSNLAWLLTIKYGQPFKSTRQEFSPPLTTWQAQWVKNMQNIDLYADKKSLQIKYATQYLEDLRNL